MTSSGTRPGLGQAGDEIELGRAGAEGKPTSISLMPTLQIRSKKRVFFSPSIGSISAWLPSRRSVDSQRGGWVMVRDGHSRLGRSICGKGRYLVEGSRNMGLISLLAVVVRVG